MRPGAVLASGGTGGPQRAARLSMAASLSWHPPSLPPRRMARGGGRGRRPTGARVLYQRGRCAGARRAA
jgi:hypothetical protein